jgi:hypothetical protein
MEKEETSRSQVGYGGSLGDVAVGGGMVTE